MVFAMVQLEIDSEKFLQNRDYPERPLVSGLVQLRFTIQVHDSNGTPLDGRKQNGCQAVAADF